MAGERRNLALFVPGEPELGAGELLSEAGFFSGQAEGAIRLLDHGDVIRPLSRMRSFLPVSIAAIAGVMNYRQHGQKANQ